MLLFYCYLACCLQQGFAPSVEEVALYWYQAQLPAHAVLRLATKLVVQERKGCCSWCKLMRVVTARLYSQHLSCLAVWPRLLTHWAQLSCWPQAQRKQVKQCGTTYC